jgi:hypothetical protein
LASQIGGKTIEVTDYLKRKRPTFDVTFSSNPLFGTSKSEIVELEHEVVSSPVVRKIHPTLGAKIGREALDNAFPFFVDIGFQLAQDWNNPYLTTNQRLTRSMVSGGVGLIGGRLAYGIAVFAGLEAWPAFGLAVLVGILFESPASNWLNDAVIPWTQSERNLKSLD